MSTIKSQLEYTNETKNLIKQEIIKKGVAVSDADPFRAYPQKIKEIQQEYPPEQTGQLLVTWFDYDGSILGAKWYNYDDSVKADDFPKKIPAHRGLVFDGWNYSIPELQNLKRYYDIGALYEPESGALQVWVEGQKNNSTVSFQIPEECTVSWGDGSQDEHFAKDADQYRRVSHTFANKGEHFIRVRSAERINLKGNFGAGEGSFVKELNLPKMVSIEETYPAGISSALAISFCKAFNGNISHTYSAKYITVPPGRQAPFNFGFLEYVSLPISAGRLINIDGYGLHLKRLCCDGLSIKGAIPKVTSVSDDILVLNGELSRPMPASSRSVTTLSYVGGANWDGRLRNAAFCDFLFFSEMAHAMPNGYELIGAGCRVFVPDSAVALFKESAGWGRVMDIIFPLSSYLQKIKEY